MTVLPNLVCDTYYDKRLVTYTLPELLITRVLQA